MPVDVKQSLTNKFSQALDPEFLEVIDESHMHSVPDGAQSHFKVTAVSSLFDGERPVKRHQKIYALANEELAGSVHALALHLYTPAEWKERGGAPDSPQCLGGSKAS